MSRTATFLWAAQLLRYPDEELLALAKGYAAGQGGGQAGTDAGLPPPPPPPPWAAAFLAHVAATPLMDMQADFVRTFDHNPAACLYLTTHAYGDSPLQGRALAALIELYRDGGCEPSSRELPDYLPVALEFLAVAPPWAASCLCEKFAPVACNIAAHLTQAESPWAGLLDAVAKAMRKCSPEAAHHDTIAADTPRTPAAQSAQRASSCEVSL